jgi:hypothetical protein
MTSLSSPIAQKINKIHKSKTGKTILSKKQIGYIVAGVIDDKVSIGFCLCHKKDKYDFIDGKRQAGFGRSLATARAVKWSDKDTIEIPSSIMSLAKKFYARCEQYYKDKGVVAIMQQPIPKVEVDYNSSAKTGRI